MLRLLILLSLTPLFGENLETFLDELTVSTKEVYSDQENYPTLSTPHAILPKINTISGDYLEESVDLVVAGSTPLSLRRFYTHTAPHDPRYMGWRFNPEHLVFANLGWDRAKKFVAAGERSGGVHYLNKIAGNTFTCDPHQQGFMTSMNGQNHPLNLCLTYAKCGDPKDRKRWEWCGTLISGDGTRRTFQSGMEGWHRDAEVLTKGKRSRLKKTYSPRTWIPYQLMVDEERLPNGNYLKYQYERWGENVGYAKPWLLKSITAYNAKKTHILGSLAFTYPKPLDGFTVTGSDGRSCHYSFTSAAHGHYTLSQVSRPGHLDQKLIYDDAMRLNRVQESDGRHFHTLYNESNRVIAQGNGYGDMYTYAYHSQWTDIRDAEGGLARHYYDNDHRLTKVESLDAGVVLKRECFVWDKRTGNLLEKRIEDGAGKVYLESLYRYDERHNVIEERVGDNVTVRTFSDDGFNLVLSECFSSGKRVLYRYRPDTNLCTHQFTYAGEVLKKRQFYTYDDAAILLRYVEDDGITHDEGNLEGVTTRLVTTIEPKRSMPCYGLPEVIKHPNGRIEYSYTSFGKPRSVTYYDRLGELSYTLTYTYDAMERLIASTDPLGHTITYVYDANNNCIATAGPRPDTLTQYAYDLCNRPIQQTDQIGDHGHLFQEKKYDRLGRLVTSIDEYGFQTHYTYDALGREISKRTDDGSTRTRKYDPLDRLIEETDPLGYTTKWEYHFSGKVSDAYYPDGSEEHFTYYPDGTLATHQHKTGALTTYAYDIFDHCVSEITYSPKHELLKQCKRTYSTYNLLSETDELGAVTTYTYNLLGEKISEKFGLAERHFSYDGRGRLVKVADDEVTHCTVYDAKDQVVSEEMIGESVIFRETKEYDEAGNVVVRATADGAHYFSYDGHGQLLSEKNPLGETTYYRYTYDRHPSITKIDSAGLHHETVFNCLGDPLSFQVMNQRGNSLQKTTYTYDKGRNVKALTHTVFEGEKALSRVKHEMEYGPFGHITRLCEGGSKTTHFTYNKMGLLDSKTTPDGSLFRYTYDSLGRRVRFFGPDFDDQFEYNARDQIITAYDAKSRRTTTREYDCYGNCTREVLGNGNCVSSCFDKYHRRTHLALPNQKEVTYRYLDHRLADITYGGYTAHYASYDEMNRVALLKLPVGEVSRSFDAMGRLADLVGLGYSFKAKLYDTHGNLRECTIDGKRATLVYDDLDQLTAGTQNYKYDSLYNRVQTGDLKQTVNGLCQRIADNLAFYAYDENGNLVAHGDKHYMYDSRNRLIRFQRGDSEVRYSYDPFDRRLSKRIKGPLLDMETKYLWDGGNEIGSLDGDTVRELRVLGSGRGAEIGSGVFFEVDGWVYAPCYDMRGSVTRLHTCLTGDIYDEIAYDDFGCHRVSKSPWTFSSKRADIESGLVYFGKRYYSPDLGVWMSPDPKGFIDGPNMYCYLKNNPYKGVDLYGENLLDDRCEASPALLKGGFHYDQQQWEQNYTDDLGNNDPFKDVSFNYVSGLYAKHEELVRTLNQASRAAGGTQAPALLSSHPGANSLYIEHSQGPMITR